MEAMRSKFFRPILRQYSIYYRKPFIVVFTNMADKNKDLIELVAELLIEVQQMNNKMSRMDSRLSSKDGRLGSIDNPLDKIQDQLDRNTAGVGELRLSFCACLSN
jgi:hypothetical protein